jgi:transcription elongation GreA/GreB family factor
MRRKAELESLLSRAQGTDFSNVDNSVVNVGTKVEVEETASGKVRRYTILGAWDSDPAHGIISYLTALAAALIKHQVGDILMLQTEDGSELQVKVNKIEPFKP